jgi:hypothetical protein
LFYLSGLNELRVRVVKKNKLVKIYSPGDSAYRIIETVRWTPRHPAANSLKFRENTFCPVVLLLNGKFCFRAKFPGSRISFSAMQNSLAGSHRLYVIHPRIDL